MYVKADMTSSDWLFGLIISPGSKDVQFIVTYQVKGEEGKSRECLLFSLKNTEVNNLLYNTVNYCIL